MAPRVAQIARTTRTKAAPAEASLAAEPRLRDSDLFVILLAVCTGMLAGLGVMLMDDLLVLLHGYISDLPNGGHISDSADLPQFRVLTMPMAGGILVGAATAVLRRWRPREVVMRSRRTRFSAAGCR
jgi:hypothetical protein